MKVILLIFLNLGLKHFGMILFFKNSSKKISEKVFYKENVKSNLKMESIIR